MFTRRFVACSLSAFALAMLCSAAAVAGTHERITTPSVLPPWSNPYGASYGEWGARWWKWVYAQDVDHFPILDPDGSSCGTGQSGPVWFLAGTFGGAVTRSCTVPAGKALFFPLVNLFPDYPCPAEFGFEPAPGQSLEDFLTQVCKGAIDGTDLLEAEVDGAPIEGLFQYRGTSGLVTFTSDPSLIALDPCVIPGEMYGVSDGYWVMLAPLSPGEHTVHFRGGIGSWTLEVTYDLVVGSGAQVLSTSMVPADERGAAAADASPTQDQTMITRNVLKAWAIENARNAHRTPGTWGALKVHYR